MHPTEVHVAIAAHSGFGHTRRQAEAVARGAASVPATSVSLLDVAELNRSSVAELADCLSPRLSVMPR